MLPFLPFMPRTGGDGAQPSTVVGLNDIRLIRIALGRDDVAMLDEAGICIRRWSHFLLS
jgi:hypothetical protein